MIKNFIMIYYERDRLTEFEKVNHQRYNSDKPKDFRLNVHRRLIELSKSRIRELYPKSEIHLIVDKKYNFEGVTEHVFEDMSPEHTSKLLMYNLLDEPAMYMDSDVLLVKPFDKSHIEVESPINPYNLNHRKVFDWNGQKYPYYSASVVYVSQPSEKIQREIQELHEKEFLYIKGTLGIKGGTHPLTSTNDEFSMSLYINQQGWEIKLFPDEVNVGRIRAAKEGGLPRIMKCQSVHYSGPKHLYEPELNEIRKKLAKFF